MQTRALKTLLKIEQVASFATAAQQLNTTLSAVSMQMKNLEIELGCTLFDRTVRPPRLTALGRAVCAHGRRVVAAEAELISFCQQSDTLVGNYRVGFVATASVRLLPLFLNQSRLEAPQAHFDVETGLSENLEERVLSGQLDAAVVTASPNPVSGLKYHTLREERLVYVVPHAAAHLPLTELFDSLSFYLFSPLSGIGKVISKNLHTDHPQRAKRVVLDSVESIMECVNRGLGFTLLPEPDVKRYIREGAEILSGEPSDLTRTLVLATQSSGPLEAQANKIAELFLNN